MAILQCGEFQLDLSAPRVMAIINLTDNSFSGDGHANQLDQALRHVDRALAEGADMLDIGAESTRPGALPVSAEQELERLLPLLERLRGCPVPISIDTLKPVVMRAVIAAGAHMINDVNGFREKDAIAAVAGSQAGLCVMHMQGEPRTMQAAPSYADVCVEVRAFLDGQVEALLAAGVDRQRIVLDPGFGFGKTLAHNLALLRNLDSFRAEGYPVLAGMSRKTMIGQITGKEVGERVAGSLAAALIAVRNGARIVRVHDVAATRDALAVWQAVYAE